jgi:hypothetical protein
MAELSFPDIPCRQGGGLQRTVTEDLIQILGYPCGRPAASHIRGNGSSAASNQSILGYGA